MPLHPVLLSAPSASTGHVFLVVGIALAITAGVLFVRARARLARWSRTTGTVVGFAVRVTKSDGRRRTYHHPQIQFEANGHPVVHTSQVGSSTPGWKIGESVAVAYDPSQPEEACIDSFREKHFVPLVLGGIGSVLSVVGALLVF